MRITLHETVSTTDGEYGELADVVVDPGTRTITHLVVQPRHRHHQARLVPMRHVRAGDDGLRLDLDAEHVHDLRRVAETEFLRSPADELDLGPDWDVGVQHVLITPTYGPLADSMPAPGRPWPMGVEYDRIPRHECEIAASSRVVAADGHDVGTVETFVVDGDHVEGVVVRSGAARRRRAVPVSAVARVRTDEIDLAVSRDEFERIEPLHGHELDARGGLAERAGRAVGRWRRRLGRALAGDGDGPATEGRADR